MAYGIAAVVAWGFVIPVEKLYPLLKIFRKLAGKPVDSGSDAETSKATEEAQGPPAKKRKQRMDRYELDELVKLMEAAIKKADHETAEKEKAKKENADKESPEDFEYCLQEIIMVRNVLDEQDGDTITCYYSRVRIPGESDEYMIQEWGYPQVLDVEYSLKSLRVGKAFSLERIMKDVPEGMSDRLREVLHFKEAGINVEDQWILMMDML